MVAAPAMRLAAYVAGLPPGDRFIARSLGVLVLLSTLVASIAFERLFLVAVPAVGGSLTEGVVGAPRFVNPVLALSDTDRDLTALTHAGLMGYDEGGNLVPVLAESYTRSEDGRTYTFVLRPGITFSDGIPVTSEDVTYTIAKAKDPVLKSPVLSNWANIQVEAVDPRTVRFTLPEAYAPFLEEATLGIMPAHVWRDVESEEFPFSPDINAPVGAGPFKVRSVSRDDNGRIVRYDLEAFEGYALGRPYLDRIRFVVYEDYAKLATGLRNGEVESAYGVARRDVLSVPYSRVFGVFFNLEDPLYRDEAVREALSIAIDRPALISDVLGGYGTPTIGPLPAGAGVPELPLPDPSTRLETAREILEDGDWKFDESAQVWRSGDQHLEVTLKTSNVPELKGLATAIQKDWNALGVPVTVELSQPNELTQSVIRPRNFGALLFGEVIGSQPDLYAFWDSGERRDPGLNITGYRDDRVDDLLEEARTEPDSATSLAKLAEANRLIASDYPAAFTHTPDFLYAVPAGLEGVTLSRIAEPSDRFQTVRYWYRYTELVWPALAK